jgi:hypothetical protein
MKKIVLSLLACMMVLTISAQRRGWAQPEYNYELSLAKDNIASTGSFKVFKVYSYAKKRAAITQDINMRNAIHGLLFKGLGAADVGYQGEFPAMVPDGYESHREYFDLFFDSGEYQQFIQLTSKGAMQAGDVVKVGKEYKVGLLVQVNVNALRKRLEKDGIIQGVRGIFTR